MGKIRELPVHVANQIAAGEVVERPASVVKELVENALDAGANSLEIRLHNGGKSLIEVRDNGEGIAMEDLELSILPHATSKIYDEEDLSSINSLGFRGEALASISAVSQLIITSRPEGQEQGWRVAVSFGRDRQFVPAGCPRGTTVQVRDLFLEVPARLKFLKARQTELSRCLKVIRAFAVCWPEVSFSVSNEKRQIFRGTPGRQGIERLTPLFGTEILESMCEISGQADGMSFEGFLASPEEVRLSSRHMYFFLNRRLITSPLIWKAVNEALRGRIVKGNFPAGVLFIDMEPELVDVNVHPSKSEVRFQRPELVYRMLYNGIKRPFSASVNLCEEPVSDSISNERVQSEIPFSTQGRTLKGDFVAEEAERAYESVANAKVQPPGLDNQGQVRIIGQFARSYILAEIGERLLVFDQHAAHEALLFKRLLNEIKDKGIVKKEPLVFPHLFTVNTSMMENLDKIREILAGLGLEVIVFGQRELAIKAIPVYLSGVSDAKYTAQEIVCQLLENPHRSGHEALRECISRMACSMAIKAKCALHKEQMASLVEDCLSEGVSSCPHGRPIMKQIDLGQMERDFFRQ